MSSENNHLNSFANTTFRFKIMVGIGVIVALCVIFNVFVWLQNSQTRRINTQIQNEDYPILIFGNRLYAEVNVSAIYLRAHLTTPTATSKQLILDTWDKSINLTLDSLRTIINRMKKPEYEAKMSKLSDFAYQLYNNQTKIINYYEEVKERLDIKLIAQDSTNATALLEKIALGKQTRDSLGQKVMKMVNETRLQIKKIIDDLNQTQTKQLSENLSIINRGLQLINTGALLTACGLFFLASLVGFLLINNIQSAISRVTRLVNKLAYGEIPPHLTVIKNEFGVMFQSINQLSESLARAGKFALQVGEGDLSQDFMAQSEKDVLGNSLIQMRDKLRKVNQEEEKRKWLSEGIAKFSDIVRNHNSSFEDLGGAILNPLIEYLGANQGGLFVAYPQNNQLIYLDLIAAYAYNRKKYLEKRVKINAEYAETLLGQVYLEKQKIYLTDIPQNYLQVTSGLGDASPRHLLILPIQTNNQVEGILEIASFAPFDNFQIEFMERVCESLAITIVSIKVSENTQALLKELKIQTDALKTQEEEMRQNMEELTSTQELMHLKQNELEIFKANLELEVQNRTAELLTTLQRANLIREAANDGIWDVVVPANGKIGPETEFIWSSQLLRTLDYTPSEFPNVLESWLNILHPDDALKLQKEFVAQLKDVSGATIFDNEHRLKLKSGEYRWFRAASKVLRDNEGKALRVAGFINEIQTQKDLERVLAELKANEEAMRQKQLELETMNAKMQTNQAILRKAMEKSQQTEKDLKAKNQQLLANEELLQDLSFNTPSVLYQFVLSLDNQQAGFNFISEYIQNLLGYTPEEFKTLDNQQLSELIHPSQRQEYYQIQSNSFENLIAFDWEGQMQHKSGKWIWVKVISTPRKANGRIISTGIFIDINELKHKELEIQAMNERLVRNERELKQNMLELIESQENIKLKEQELNELKNKLIQ